LPEGYRNIWEICQEVANLPFGMSHKARDVPGAVLKGVCSFRKIFEKEFLFARKGTNFLKNF
jgi:hypothetical protein